MRTEDVTIKWVHRIAAALWPDPIYLVGGAVRNELMGLPLSDIDVCGPLTPHQMMARLEGTHVRAVLRAAHFGTVELHIKDDEGRHMAEYTTFRQDSYRGGHSPEAVRFAKDIPTDALRRDFSVNALYRQVLPKGLGEVIDPCGGLEDMARHNLHTVTKSPYQVLKDDGLRLMRMVRFACELDLTPSQELLACAKDQAPLLKQIVPERLRVELEKILLSDTRYPSLARRMPAVEQGLALLDTLGYFSYLLPHCTINAADAAGYTAPSLFGRMAALIGSTPQAKAQADLLALRFSHEVVQKTLAFISVYQQYPAWEEPRWALLKAGAEAQAHLVYHLNAQWKHTQAQHITDMWQSLIRDQAPLTLKELGVNGYDLKELGIPSIQIGQCLNALWRQVVLKQCENQREDLLKAARQLAE